MKILNLSLVACIASLVWFIQVESWQNFKLQHKCDFLIGKRASLIGSEYPYLCDDNNIYWGK